MVDSLETPQAQLFHRNHGDILHLDHAAHVVQLSIHENLADSSKDIEALTISMKELADLPQTEVTAALQCAGNRRSKMSDRHRKTEGIPWYQGVVA